MMTSSGIGRRRALAIGTAGGLAAAGGFIALRRHGRERLRPPALARAPLLIAHRGGAKLAPENTLEAFVAAVRRWGADMLELDVHATADGHCVVMHDPVVDRTTDGTGEIAAMTLDELRALDAGYRFTRDGGQSFPFRGRGVRVPTLDEVLDALPGTPVIAELKANAAQRPLFAAVERAGAADRVIAAGIYDRDRTLLDEYPGAISGSKEQLRAFYLVHRARLGRFWAPAVDVIQVPEVWDDRRIVTPRFISDVHAHGLTVQVWTVDDPADMHRLLDWGVDGLMSDRPDILARVLHERAGRPLPPGLEAARVE